MNIDSALPGFVAESSDLLREMEAALLECSGETAPAETVNLIFRCAHTIKGSAGLFGLSGIVDFVHVVETILDDVRRGRMPLRDELVSILLSCSDHMHSLIAAVGSASDADPGTAARGAELVARLRQAGCVSGNSHPEVPGAGGGQAAAEVSAPSVAADAPAAIDWRLSVRFAAGVLAAGMDPLGFIRYLRSFCELRRLKILDGTLPPPEEFQPEHCYLGFELELSSAAERSRIEGAFDFVREDCTLKLERLQNAEPQAPVAALPLQDRRRLADRRRTSAGAGPGTPVEVKAVPGSFRVDAAKLDALITRVGELIIAAAGVDVLARKDGSADLRERASTLATLVEQVREGTLQLRMVKIGGTFDRFKRIVRDVSRELHKDIGLVVRGEDTELDKTVVERITDPLTHLVRNAVDHGIESAEVRTARGKPASGTITLNAFHDSGNIVIEVQDDGGGLRRERILAKAQERGLVKADRTLTDQEVLNLIFEPGLSTAETLTTLSGRGVGMDVVKKNITALRGSVAIASVEGRGTTITIRLPLTLAIINGFQVGVGGNSFVLPLESIDECIEFSHEPGQQFTNLRGQALPYVRLRELTGCRGAPPSRSSIVVVSHSGARIGIVVDSLAGECQAVIKPLGKTFRKADFVSGSSILGNGQIALILDIPALVHHAICINAADARAAFST